MGSCVLGIGSTQTLITEMSQKERDEKILEFFRAVFKKHDETNEGTIKTADLCEILGSLGRSTDMELLDNQLIKRFEEEGKGKIEWNTDEFLMMVALMDVVDVNAISDSVFEAGFKTFDQDKDGFLTHLELHTAARLFLPMDIQEDEEYLEDLINKMDVKDDGKIALPEFEHFIKETGAPL